VVELVTLKKDRLRDIVSNELKVRIRGHVAHISLGTGEEVINRHHLVPLAEQHITQMRSYKTGSATHYHSRHIYLSLPTNPKVYHVTAGRPTL
jgi:hypothetical protein